MKCVFLVPSALIRRASLKVAVLREVLFLDFVDAFSLPTSQDLRFNVEELVESTYLFHDGDSV